MDLNDKPLWQLTAKEFLEVAKVILPTNKASEDMPLKTKREYVYGIIGIANLLGCSKSKVSRIKDTILKPAIIKNGRSIIGDAELLLELYNQNAD